MTPTKTCSKCHKTKPLDEFHNNKSRKDGKTGECKECRKKTGKEYYQEHREEHNIKSKDHYHNRGGREKQGCQSMFKNRKCTQFLGIVIAERLFKHLFNNVTMMPYGHPGFDALCQNMKRINVKASTIHVAQLKNSTVNRWSFTIDYNKDCDFFLLMAFDNIIELNPLIAWLVPGKELNKQKCASISATTIHKWDKFKMDLDNAQQCCDLMKESKQ